MILASGTGDLSLSWDITWPTSPECPMVWVTVSALPLSLPRNENSMTHVGNLSLEPCTSLTPFLMPCNFDYYANNNGDGFSPVQASSLHFAYVPCAPQCSVGHG